MQSQPIMEQEFFPLRAKLLEIGAALDRLDRAGSSLKGSRGWRRFARQWKSCTPPTAMRRADSTRVQSAL